MVLVHQTSLATVSSADGPAEIDLVSQVCLVQTLLKGISAAPVLQIMMETVNSAEEHVEIDLAIQACLVPTQQRDSGT